EHDAQPEHDLSGDRDAGQPPYPFVSDETAMQLVRDHVRDTPAGYDFYPDGDRMHQYADAYPRHPGEVVLDLHASPEGFRIGNRVLTGEQFAHAIDQLRQEGRIRMGEDQEVRLAACEVGRGEDSPAAAFARESGLTVKAPTERVWSNMRGEERVSSGVLQDG